jgi:hypothetical protein
LMSAGHMPMFARAALLVLMAGPVAAESADCRRLSAVLGGLTGYAVTAPPSGLEDGWCVFDRGVLKAQGAPDLAVERLRLKDDYVEGALVALSLEASGLRLDPGWLQSSHDPVLRETLRLQTAEVTATVRVGPEGLELRDVRLRLSGGTEVMVEADIAGAGMSAGALVLGRLTRLDLDWRNDGKLLRPVMQAWGESLVDGTHPERGVKAARLALQHRVMNLPDAMFQDDGKDRLDEMLDDLPQGRGWLRLEFRSAEGIGAAQVGVAALSGDPLGPGALARLFAGATVAMDWTPGLAP